MFRGVKIEVVFVSRKEVGWYSLQGKEKRRWVYEHRKVYYGRRGEEEIFKNYGQHHEWGKQEGEKEGKIESKNFHRSYSYFKRAVLFLKIQLGGKFPNQNILFPYTITVYIQNATFVQIPVEK